MTRSVATPKDRLRVLYLSWRDRENPEAGGAETFTERTSEVLTDLGHQVTIFTASFPGASPRTPGIFPDRRRPQASAAVPCRPGEHTWHNRPPHPGSSFPTR